MKNDFEYNKSKMNDFHKAVPVLLYVCFLTFESLWLRLSKCFDHISQSFVNYFYQKLNASIFSSATDPFNIVYYCHSY